MKSERRHDLESNELVVWLDKFRPYTGQATAVVAVVVSVLAIGSIWNSGSEAKQEAAWDAFALANDTSDPELMALLSAADNEEYAGTSMPEWAHVTWADRQLLLAGHAYLADRSAARSRLKKVEGIYSTLAAGASDSEVKNRARFGLARVFELQNKLDEAKEQYAMVQGDLESLASERATQLDLPEVREACAWLATADLPLPASSGAHQGQPNFDVEFPATDSGEFNTKTLEDLLENLTKQSGKTEKRYSEDDEEKATEEETAAPEDSAAAEQSPADDKPAEQEAKPETEAPVEPASEKPAAEASEAEATEASAETAAEGQ
ncbi:MAG: hypothetical protein GXP26_08890 [Planctomycetes bacterium]|nr:hypothetical protein [Planctomycetota bacterium]